MTPPRIVVIDPHPAVRQAVVTYFDTVGYTVVVHPHAADAVTVIRQLQPPIALIGLHLDYPLAGLDVVRALHADPATRAIPIIIWSTDAEVTYHVAALGLPGVTALSKYADPAILQAAIAQASADSDDRRARHD